MPQRRPRPFCRYAFSPPLLSAQHGTEHEAWFREDTEVIDFFAPPREDFLLGGKPAYISEGEASGNAGPM